MVDPVEKFLRHFMRKTGRLRTLRELEKDWSSDFSERKRASKVKLSFDIQKPPERMKTKTGVGKKLKKHETKEEKVKIPPEFLKIAKKFGLPEVHLEFFYENREKFHWERIESSRLHLGSTNANLHLQKTLLFVGFCRVLSGFRKPTKPDVKN
jgi:hypothetical protein